MGATEAPISCVELVDFGVCAEGGIRTHMGLPPPAFEAGASAVPPLRLVLVTLSLHPCNLYLEVHGHRERLRFPARRGHPASPVVLGDHQPARRSLLVQLLHAPAPALE